jgi:hypothetical protein
LDLRLAGWTWDWDWDWVTQGPPRGHPRLTHGRPKGRFEEVFCLQQGWKMTGWVCGIVTCPSWGRDFRSVASLTALEYRDWHGLMAFDLLDGLRGIAEEDLAGSWANRTNCQHGCRHRPECLRHTPRQRSLERASVAEMVRKRGRGNSVIKQAHTTARFDVLAITVPDVCQAVQWNVWPNEFKIVWFGLGQSLSFLAFGEDRSS